MKRTYKLEDLAVNGGPKINTEPAPPRRALGPAERAIVNELFDTYEKLNVDYGYQGIYEKRYTDAFIKHLSVPGYADAVSSGTSSLFVAIAALQLPKNTEVLVSPISDPGALNAIILNGLIPKLVDSMPNSYNIGPEQLKERVTKKTKALLVVHATGRAAPILEIMKVCRKHNIKVIEDCSQAHGALYKGQQIGTFGDIAAFSTMYRKNHISGGCGGIIYTKSKKYYDLIRSYADRGKPFDQVDFNEKDPTTFLFPALNLNQDELSCAVGLSSINRLDETRKQRLQYLRILDQKIKSRAKTCSMMPYSKDDSPFFQTIFVNASANNMTVADFGRALQAEGISVNPHFKYGAQTWPYIKPYLADDYNCKNAMDCIDNSFNILFHENFTEKESEYTIRAIEKIESVVTIDSAL